MDISLIYLLGSYCVNILMLALLFWKTLKKRDFSLSILDIGLIFIFFSVSPFSWALLLLFLLETHVPKDFLTRKIIKFKK